MTRVNICKLIDGCGGCPFINECGLDFNTIRPKDRWIDELKERIEKLQNILDKVKEQ